MDICIIVKATKTLNIKDDILQLFRVTILKVNFEIALI